MKIFENKTQALETTTEYNKISKNYNLISNRCLLSYYISDDRAYLIKALNFAIAGLNNDAAHYDLFMTAVFLYIETGDLKQAETLLDKIDAEKNYFKNNDVRYYIIVMFLTTYLHVKSGNQKTVNRFRKLFPSMPNDAFPNETFMFLAVIDIELGNYEDAAVSLEKAFNAGTNSTYFFVSSYRYLKEGFTPFNSDIFYKTLSWAMAQGLDVVEIVQNNKSYCESAPHYNITFYKRLYLVCESDWVLALICGKYLELNDKSAEALKYYKKAEEKKILTTEQQKFYLEVAYENDLCSLNIVGIIDYLEETKNISPDMRAYIYYNFLADPKFKNIVEKNKMQIIQLAIYGLEKDLSDDYYLSLYAYFISCSKEQNLDSTLINFAEKKILHSLFRYTITVDNTEVKNVWVKNNLLDKFEIVPVVHGEIEIQSASKEITVICLNNIKNKVLISDVMIRRKIPNVDITLLIYFYNKGVRDVNLIIAITEALVKVENNSVDVIPIMEKILRYKDINIEFRNKINVSIGSIYFKNNEYRKSLKYYFRVEDGIFEDKFAEPVLMSFIHSKEYEKAVALILTRHSTISDRGLFFSIKEIQKNADVYKLSNIAYNLLMRGWFDKILVEIVVENFNGELKKWMALSALLGNVSDYVDIVNEIVLEKSMFQKKIDNDILKVFIQAYKNDDSKKIISDFVYFISYKIMLENLTPEYEVIKIIEEMNFKKDSEILCFALAHVYIKSDIETDSSKEILAKAISLSEKNGYMIPCLKEIKDKNMITPYIDKNQPFMYKTLPDRKVYLNYKINDETEFKKIEMQYFKYGIYLAKLITFFGEKTTYFISEEFSTGTTQTPESVIINDKVCVNNKKTDKYYLINEAMMQEKLLKYDDVYNIIYNKLITDDEVYIRGRLM